MANFAESSKTYVVEHLDPELEQWSALEYAAIAKESYEANAQFLLSSVPESLATNIPGVVKQSKGIKIEQRSVEEIFASQKESVCLLDPAASKELSPEDGDKFTVFLFGGILGDDPPRDRTSELRKKGYEGRRLGPVQMTTDTAVRVTRIVVQDRTPLEKIEYVDHPELKVNKHESTEMPFRYVKGKDGEPVMPEGMIDLIKNDSERGFGELL
ncbi:DUF431-domain-containing protein [Pseudovirgaria hyperparasitica]|uniref:DUF431-domain-containing protein n=1 Tax=Pseudovirgaria hyperparasitica TaxID=470096 RepID=A0A6A6WE17_9PEZI|nr:DUF431-domain-containing protein [Pseudovirgaria hyperparasitica]KAF2759807.1 DUF431-domain-containing protein [Pseudovirgaria hyperparasitica]